METSVTVRLGDTLVRASCWAQKTVSLQSGIVVSLQGFPPLLHSGSTFGTSKCPKCTSAWVPSTPGEAAHWGMELRHLHSVNLPHWMETTARYQLAPVRVAVTKKKREASSAGEDVGRGNAHAPLPGVEPGATIVEDGMEALATFKKTTTRWSSSFAT